MPKYEKRKQLNKADLAKALKELRHWPKVQLDRIAPLVWHIRYQATELYRLTAELHELRQQAFFAEKRQLDTPKQIRVPEPPAEKWPLPKRLEFLRRTRDDRGWAVTLKLNGLTEESATELVNEFLAQHV